MKVKELIKELKKFDGEKEVIVNDSIEGNDSPLLGLGTGEYNTYDGLKLIKKEDVIYIIW